MAGSMTRFGVVVIQNAAALLRRYSVRTAIVHGNMEMIDSFKTAHERILEYAKELEMRDYHGALANWQKEYRELMARCPRPPSWYTGPQGDD